jgi:Emfourin
MRIQFRPDGGLASFPGLERPLELDTAELAPEQAASLERLVRDAGVFALPARAGAPAPGAADYRSYTITVDDGARSHTITVAEPIEDAALRALVERLGAEQRSRL